MRVGIFGTGYVGLVQAAVFADVGHDVVCVDVDAARIERLRAGEVPIFEPGLDGLVAAGAAGGRLHFTTDAAEAVADCPILLIAVGTPPDEDGSADLRHVLAVADTIAAHMDAPRIVVTKSTVPVGTCDRVRERIDAGLAARSRSKLGFDVAANPEFLKEGSAVVDCARPERIIIGTSSPATEAALRELYAPLNRNHEKIIVMDMRSAELTKYAANAMLATKISFMNEMANLAGLLGADIEKVRRGIGSDPRIGYDFIYAGAGYGGSCFPKDVRAAIRISEGLGFDAMILRAVEARNERQKLFLFDRIVEKFGPDLTGRTFALWGLAFKPNTDDMREAPSRVLMEALWRAGARVQAYDPKAMPECRRLYGERSDLLLCTDADAAAAGADALLVVTEWRNFQAPDFDRLRLALRQPLVFDGRNIYEPAMARTHGIEVIGIGRA